MHSLYRINIKRRTILRTELFCTIILFFALSCIQVLPVFAAIADTPYKEPEKTPEPAQKDSDTFQEISPHSGQNVRSMLLKAVNSKDASLLKKLIIKWPKHAKGEYSPGKTLLRIAIKGGSSEVVKVLLKNDTSDIDLKDKNGFTPLMAAAVWQNYDIVKLLVENGADLNIQDNMGNTAIFRAIFTRNNDILKLLIRSGADVNIPNASGDTPLKMVEGSEQGVIMKQLLKERK
jgi:ankyrin repeat protein